MRDKNPNGFERIIIEICSAQWRLATVEQLLNVCHAYYCFSVQFRENFEIACRLYPNDNKLIRLSKEECNTDNLSPWAGIAQPTDKLDHYEFIRRALLLEPQRRRPASLDDIGISYLIKIREINPISRAKSIASYEDNGLRRIFLSILEAPHWDGPILEAFRFFLLKHLEFDSGAESEHGSLSRHLVPDCSVMALWRALKDLLDAAVPEIMCAGASEKIDSLVAVSSEFRCSAGSAAGCEEGNRSFAMSPSA
jgi:hypothetical protein